MSGPGGSDPPLAGRRIVVTRAAEQAGTLSDRLAALGADPIIVPLIEIVASSDDGAALNAALADLSRYDWIAVTSPNGAWRVRELVSATRASTGGRPLVAVAGTATAAALGFAADIAPRTQSAAGLVAEFPAGSGRVLVAQGEAAEATLVDGLRAKGWSVDAVAAYRTVSRVPSSAVLLEVLSADAVLFASGSAARAWCRVFGTATPASVFAIGPTTAQVAADLGLKVDVVATDHSLDGLVDSVLMYWANSGYGSDAS